MNKTALIIAREYLSRVKKKSFIVITLLVPLLFVGMYAAIMLFAADTDSGKQVIVVDQSGVFKNKFTDTESIHFVYSNESLELERQRAMKEEDRVLLHIADFDSLPEAPSLSASKQVSMPLTETVQGQLEKIIRDKKLREAGIDTKLLEEIRVNIPVVTTRLTEEGESQTSAGASLAIAGLACMLIYLSIFIYGAQVMRGVIEEKTSRIVEIIVSSVKPWQLMLGKILGIALVGLTQFLLWIAFTLIATGVIKSLFMGDISTGDMAGAAPDNTAMEVLQALQTLPVAKIMVSFVLYFLGGQLLYSALFAAIGSAVDSESETQQFMLPITMPLLFAYIASFRLIMTPDSPFLFWLSMIPFTSPLAMMVRLPFGVPLWQLVLSIFLLIATFFLVTWLAARIYRTGILMYGKKVSFRELGKWIFHNN